MRTRIGSDDARRWVRSIHFGNPYAKAILMAVANYMNEDGTAFPGIATLHADTEIAENTITARLRWCESIGAITLSKTWIDDNGCRNRAGRGRPTSLEIRFLFDADVQAIEQAAQEQSADRPLRGAALAQHEKKMTTVPAQEISPEGEAGTSCGEEQTESDQHLSSTSVAPHQPLTPAPRILESEKTYPQTPSREEAGRGFQEKIDEEFEKDFEELKANYPQGILDLEAARKEFLRVPAVARKLCIRALPVYADRLRGRGRHPEKSMKAHIFIRKRCWEGLLAVADKPAAQSQHPANSEAGRALLTLARIMRYTPLILSGNVIYSGEITPRIRALATAPHPNDWKACEKGSRNYAAWRDLAWSVWSGKGFAYDSIDMPWEWPPRVDGSIITSGSGPPGESNLSKDDVDAFTG